MKVRPPKAYPVTNFATSYNKTALNMKEFVHLHVHSYHSKEGLGSIKEIVDKAETDGMRGIAITDHCSIAGAIQLNTLCFEKIETTGTHIKPIIGCEFHITEASLLNQQSHKSSDHIVVLAKNEDGYQNIVTLINKAWSQIRQAGPTITYDDLAEHHNDLIILSGCIGGAIPKGILKNHGITDEVRSKVLWFKSIWGDDFYLEIMRHKVPDGGTLGNREVYEMECEANKYMLELSKEYGVKVVATNDCHFIYEDDAGRHDDRLCEILGRNKNDSDRIRYTRQEWLKTQAEMNELFSDIPEALDATIEIRNKCEFYELWHEVSYPKVPLLPPYDNLDEQLVAISSSRLTEKLGGKLPSEYKERLDWECSLISSFNFSPYFLFMDHIVRVAREELGFMVGPGRSSAAGSLVNYALGITQIDPIKHDLLFERFLSPDGISLPDIDIDLEWGGRDNLIQYLINEYGEDYVLNIVSNYYDHGIVNHKRYPSSEAIVRKDVHVCGIAISDQPIRKVLPIEEIFNQSKEKYSTVSQYDAVDLETTGIAKFDFLDMQELSDMKSILALIKENTGVDLDINEILLDDEATLAIFRQGETDSILSFQYGKEWMKVIQPTSFSDLVQFFTMFRPGPMDKLKSFADRKNGKEAITYPLPCMSKYLSDTYGLLIYQEQLMMLARMIGDFDRVDSDEFRKVICKRRYPDHEEMKKRFYEGARKNGYSEPSIDKVWDMLYKEGLYCCNKSHAVCYTLIAYQMAYLKAHYPKEFGEIIKKEQNS